ncbi:glutaminyl-peptide cyclotransferase [Fundidesulfovibrio terrae]|uniref:glutaminyl-peptide cyclotransferase n=1 Tax=Fundidesulfovibrio terrae TaxID=2922866 RepID=UPI001FB0315A|nr:glutaminyl-peptide cyclotransferase [Fundidesulfovibrio terrae]
MAVILLAAFPVQAQSVRVGYTVTAVLPHDPKAFTQGLLLHEGSFYESTGLYGRSSLRKVEPSSGKVLDSRELDKSDFGEGLALAGGRFYQLTWLSGKVLVYDAATLAPQGSLPLEGEGWGIAATPFGLVVSDGSNVLTWRDAASFKPVRTLAVTDNGRPVIRLNELEWVEGFILANVWHEDRIAIISPATGKVAAWIDCAPLRARLQGLPAESDLNGIAWDPTRKKLYVTGKLWPAIFELALEGLPRP